METYLLKTLRTGNSKKWKVMENGYKLFYHRFIAHIVKEKSVSRYHIPELLEEMWLYQLQEQKYL